jgi:hypothetical protein
MGSKTRRIGDREKPGAERIAILGLGPGTTAEPVSYAKLRPCFERGMARDAVASATRDAGDIRCEVGIAPGFSRSPYSPLRDPAEFARVKIDPEVNTLVWPSGADFDPAILHDWPKQEAAFRAAAQRWSHAMI